MTLKGRLVDGIGKVGIVGCGVMGSGIGQLCALKGFHVTLCEKDEALLKKGLKVIEAGVAVLAKKGKINESDHIRILGSIRGTTDIKDFHECDLVIEAVPEDLGLKKRVFMELDGVCKGEAILASNTSVLSVIEMARVTSRPEKVLGTHFLTPPQVNPLLEIVKTLRTSQKTLTKIVEFGESLGKKVIVSKDSPGFVVNRILTAVLLNAVRLLDEGVATKEDIETAVTVGLGMPMGPFGLLDLIGLDTIAMGTEALFRDLNDPQYACPLRIKRMVSAGWLGRKSGKGFYEYTPGSPG